MASTRSPTSSWSESAKSSVGNGAGRALQPQDGEIGALIACSTISAVELAPVGQGDLHLVGLGHDVVVGDDQPAGVDDDAGAERALHPLARRPEILVAEEAAEERIGEEGRDRLLARRARRRRSPPRRDPLDDRREGEPDLPRRIAAPAAPLGGGSGWPRPLTLPRKTHAEPAYPDGTAHAAPRSRVGRCNLAQLRRTRGRGAASSRPRSVNRDLQVGRNTLRRKVA